MQIAASSLITTVTTLNCFIVNTYKFSSKERHHITPITQC